MTTGTDLIPVDPVRMAEDERLVQRRFWSKVRATLGRVPFMEDVLAAYYCLSDSHTPARAKAILLGALAYFILPADALPDFLLGLGFTDDAAVLFAAIETVRAHLRPDHYDKARAFLREEAGEGEGEAPA